MVERFGVAALLRLPAGTPGTGRAPIGGKRHTDDLGVLRLDRDVTAADGAARPADRSADAAVNGRRR